jgi:hypothetical protein
MMAGLGDAFPGLGGAAAPYADRWRSFLTDLQRAGVSIDPTQSGGYSPRTIRGTSIPSMHASGRAYDVNWNSNPEGRAPDQGDIARQMLERDMGNGPPVTAIHPFIARDLAQRHGLTWGGDFRTRSPDPMHFQIAGAPAGPMQNRSITQFAGMSPPAPSAASAPTPEQGPAMASPSSPASSFWSMFPNFWSGSAPPQAPPMPPLSSFPNFWGGAAAGQPAPMGVPQPTGGQGGIGSDFAASPPPPPPVPQFDEGTTSLDPETTMRLAQAEHARQNPVAPTPRRPGFGEAMESWMTSPLFQMAVALATQRDPAAAMASAGTAQRQRSEYERQQQQRATMDRIWGEAFPNGQPNMQHPLLRGQSPEVAAMFAGMGPEAAIPQLATAAMNRSKIDYRTLKEGEQLVATTGSGQVMPVPGIGGGQRATEAVRTDAAKVNQAFNNITAALDDYQRRINASGPVWRPGTARDAITQQITNIQLQLKELFNLGVLNGPDLQLMQGMLPDPNLSAGNLIADRSLAERTQAAVRNLKEILRQRRDNANAAAGSQPLPMPQPAAPASNDPLGIR